jgi:carboxyl-terminal processing protease
MKNPLYLRYPIAVLALSIAFVLTIRYSESDFLLDARGRDVLASPSTAEDVYDLQALAVVNRVLLNLRDSYVEPDRIDPGRMLVRALDRVQNSVPQVVALFNDELEGRPTRVEVRVGSQSQEFDLESTETLWQMSFKLREIFRFLQTHLDASETDLQDIEYAAINGMLTTLDPHSAILTPRIYEDYMTGNRGSFGGLGIVVSIRDNQLTVISPIPNTPASRAGFRAGDRIVKINDESTVNMPLDEAVSRLRGPVGTRINLEMMRTGWVEPHAFELEREVITVASVAHHALGDRIGYIRINSFQDNTWQDMVRGLNELRETMGGLDGLVLDLRNNPGGLLQQAIRISDTFLREGTIVTTIGHADRLREENPANRTGTEPDYPIVILVNSGSASASEIVAGALKNHDRALIVGEQTWGKGSVQTLTPYPDGSALKLTVSQYLTPGDISIQGIGIVPDIRLYAASMTDEFLDLYPSVFSLREGDLEGSLTTDRSRESNDQPFAELSFLQEPTDADSTNDDPDAFVLDFEIRLARELVQASTGVSDRTQMMVRARDVLERTRTQEMRSVQERLRTRNVDWSDGPNVIQPVRLEMRTNRAENRAEAGKSVELILSATNEGTRPLHRVRAVSRSAYSLFDDREFVFGRLDAGETRTWTVRFEIPSEDPTRLEAIRFHAFADTIRLESETEGQILVTGLPRPHWGIAYRIADEEHGNGDGLLQLGERVRLLVDVTNSGAGDSGRTSVVLRNRSDRAIFLHTGRETTESVEVGERWQASFEFTLQERPEDGIARFDLDVYDETLRQYLREEVEFAIRAEAPPSQAHVGHVRALSETPLHAGAHADTPVIAVAQSGTILESHRLAGEWLHVSWPEGAGWLHVGGSEPVASGPASATGVARMIVLQPPQIRLDGAVWDTREESFQLTGSIIDDHQVLDWYLFVYNHIDERRTQSVKRVYEYVGAPTATLSARIPLRPGMNRITLVARDDQKAMSSEVMYVYRHE